MSANLGPQFQVKDWNPFVGASHMLDKLKTMGSDYNKYQQKVEKSKQKTDTTNVRYKQAQTLQKHTIPTPSNTGAPIPGYRVRQTPTPQTTGAPMPGELATKTAIHPITGARVHRTPVKRSNYKQTPPGTKPKPRKAK